MAKAGEDEEVRDRARAIDINFGKKEIPQDDEESCCVVWLFSEHKSFVLLLLLGRGGRMTCKLPTKLIFLFFFYDLFSSPPNTVLY